MKRRDAIRIAIALVVALALHAIFLRGLAIPKPQRIEAPPLRIRLVTREPARVQSTVERSVSASVAHPVVPATSMAPRATSSQPVPQIVGPERRDQTDGRAGLSLALKEPYTSPPDTGAGLRRDGVARQSAAESRAMERSVVRDRLQNWVADAQTRQQMEFPDVYWRDAARALGNTFRPGADLFEHAAHGDTGGNRAMDERELLARGGASGSASVNEGLVALPNEARGLGSVSLSGVPQSNIDVATLVGLVAARGQQRLVALVRIRQDANGRISAVELATSSGSAPYDRLALDSAGKLDTLRSAAPSGARETLWRFETAFVDVMVKKSVSSHVQLAAVH